MTRLSESSQNKTAHRDWLMVGSFLVGEELAQLVVLIILHGAFVLSAQAGVVQPLRVRRDNRVGGIILMSLRLRGGYLST